MTVAAVANTNTTTTTVTTTITSANLEPATGKFLQFGPHVVEMLLFALYLCNVAVAAGCQSVRCLVDVVNALLVRSHLSQKLIKFLLQDLSPRTTQTTKASAK